MKIILGGTIIKVVRKVNKYRVECKSCKSMLEFTREDIKSNEVSPTSEFIICPVCEEIIEVRIKLDTGERLLRINVQPVN